MKSIVTFNPSLIDFRRKIVDNQVITILSDVGEVSKNPQIQINSTIRPPLEQANAMYDNEKAGKHIVYAAPGKEVIAIYNDNKFKPRAEVIGLMINKIEELARAGKLVSRHCVPEDIYRKNPIIDVGINIPNPRDLTRALSDCKEVSKIITPLTSLPGSPYNTSKVFVDAGEPAIHIEFKLE